MPHNAAFYQGLLCAKTELTFRERNVIILEIIACGPSIYIVEHPYLTLSNFMGNSIGTKRVNDLKRVVSWVRCGTCT